MLLINRYVLACSAVANVSTGLAAGSTLPLLCNYNPFVHRLCHWRDGVPVVLCGGLHREQ
jgi:hypothetical protein